MALTIRRNVLTLICADLDARPLFWTETDRRRQGYEPEIAAKVASMLNLELEWKFLRWSDFVPELLTRSADAIWCGSAITPEREKQMLFSEPYALFNESVLVRCEDRIQSPADLRGRPVGAITGSTNMKLAQQWPDVSCIGFDGASDDVFADMINALRAGDIDAVVDDEPAFGGILSEQEFTLAFTVATENWWGAAMHPDSTGLKQLLDQALSELKKAGEIESSWKAWLDDIELPESLSANSTR